jgi:hypothetical protein
LVPELLRLVSKPLLARPSRERQPLPARR